MADDDDPLREYTVDARLAYQGAFLEVHSDTARTPDGHISPREYLRHPGAVMIIPMLDDGRLVLERQWRYPLGRAFIEFPAGKIDPGEALLRCAQRELVEETGYVASQWDYLGGFHNAIGYCDEQIHIYLARGLTQQGAKTDAGEVLEVFTWTAEQLRAAIVDGRVSDAKTVIGSYWLEAFLQGRWPAREPR
jgi:ADP-ribose pyrophosphatase